MIASITRTDIDTVKSALVKFKDLGLIEVLNDGTIYMLEIQTLIGKSSTEADRVRLYRGKIKDEKQLAAGQKCDNCRTNDVRMYDKNTPEIEIEIEKDIDIERENRESTAGKPPEAESVKSISTPYEEIKNLYLTICVSYPRVQTLSANRKKAIHARWVQYHNIEAFKRLFEKAEASDFLKGSNSRNWAAGFDWLLNDANMAKTLEGKYDNDKSAVRHSSGSKPDISTPDNYKPPQDDDPLPF